VSVDRRWWETSVVRGRILAAGLVLLAAGFGLLGVGSRFGHAGLDKVPAVTVSPFVTPGLASAKAVAPENEAQIRARTFLSGLPLAFEPNQGQGHLKPADERARFVARGSGYGLFLGSQGATLTLLSPAAAKQDSATVNVIEMKLAGADPSATLAAVGRLPGKSNYFLGNDPSKWRVGVPQFARVQYQHVYPGINLVFYGNQGQLEYDFQVAPGADPSKAELEFRGVNRLDLKDGALRMSTDAGSLQLQAPRVYQEIAGHKHVVEGRFVLRGANRAGFEIGAYDRSRELIIDPILNFSTYFGGSGDERGTSVAVDGSFNIYLAGSTTSGDLPAAGVYQTTLKGAGPNVYIAKMTPPLGVATLDYVTYLGGSGQDSPVGIKVDGAGRPYVAGTTSSSDFPTTPLNAYQKAPASTGKQHVFVSQLSADATSLLYSTYLSGNGVDVASGMTINAGGNVFVTGTTTSVETSSNDQFPATNLPHTPLPYQSTSRAPGQPQFFVTEVNPAAPGTASVTYSTYFGGGTFSTATPVAIGGGIAVDTSGNVYFSGTTNYTYAGCAGCSITDFPILNAYQPCLDTAPPANIVVSPTCSSTASTTESDAFIAKLNLNPGAQQFVWSTYLGGTGTDSSTGVALDPGAASIYVVGTTNSQDFATSATTLNTSASYQKCLNNLPQTVPGTVTCTQQTNPAPTDAFVARLSNPAATSTSTSTNIALNYFSYLGGANDEAGNAITVDSAAGALVTGWTQSPNTAADGTFPISLGAVQPGLLGTQDAFIARLNTSAVVGQTTVASWATYFGGTALESGTGIALDVNQNTYLAGESNSADLQVNKPLSSAEGGGPHSGTYDAFVAQFGTVMSLSIQGALTQGTNQQNIISAGNQATFTYTITNNGPDLANNLTVIANLSSTVTGVPLTFNSASVSSGTCGGASTNAIVSCSVPSLQAGSTATVTIVVTPTGTPTGSPQSFNGGTVQVMAPGNFVAAETSVGATMSDFTMLVTPSNQTVAKAGLSGNYSVQLTPQPLYASSITVSCSNLPTGASCRTTPSSSITLQGAGGSSVNLAITTTARPVTTAAASFLRSNFYALWFAMPGFLLVGIGRPRGRRRIASVLMLCALSLMLLLIPACSHSTTQTPVSGTPAGSYSVTVTAASGSDTKTQTVILNVP
jgi:hypothetical protein